MLPSVVLQFNAIRDTIMGYALRWFSKNTCIVIDT